MSWCSQCVCWSGSWDCWLFTAKRGGKLIPMEVSNGAGLKWLYICPPRNIDSSHLIWGFQGRCASLATLRQPWSAFAVQKSEAAKVVGSQQCAQGDPGLCWGCSTFVIVDFTCRGQSCHSDQVRYQPPCTCLGSHPSPADRTSDTFEVATAKCQNYSSKMGWSFGALRRRSQQSSELRMTCNPSSMPLALMLLLKLYCQGTKIILLSCAIDLLHFCPNLNNQVKGPAHDLQPCNSNDRTHNRAGWIPVMNSSYCEVGNMKVLAHIAPFYSAWHHTKMQRTLHGTGLHLVL